MTTASTLKDLKKAWQDAEDEARRLTNERDSRIAEIRKDSRDAIRSAVEKAVRAQREYLSHDAAHGLSGRKDAEVVARSLGLTDSARNLGIVAPEAQPEDTQPEG